MYPPYHFLSVLTIGAVGGGRARDRVLFESRHMDEFLSGPTYGYLLWESEGVSKTARDTFCDDDNRYFFKWKWLLFSFTKIENVANVADLTQRDFFCITRY